MPRPRPFIGHLVAPSRAQAVIAPPYDALTVEQREAMASTEPDSFLGALPSSGTSRAQDLDQILARCRRTVERLLAQDRFVSLDRPVLAVVAIDHDTGRTVAIVGDLPVDDFDLDAREASGAVRPHERVDAHRVERLARYLEVVGVASTPVAVVHRPNDAVTRTVEPVLQRPPQLGVHMDDGVDLTVWIVADPDDQERLASAVESAGTLYVADGHHRAAAVAAYAARQRAPQTAGRVLTAVIPSDHLDVLPFHRRVRGIAVDDVARRLESFGEVREVGGPLQPQKPGTVAVTSGGSWWAVELGPRPEDDPVERLDVRVVERELLPALVGDAPGAAAPHVEVEPVAAPAGLRALEGDGMVGVALAPPGIDAILQVADAGASMPAKTTYVTPKLRSGLFLVGR